MLNRCCALIAGAFLLLAVLTALPSAAATQAPVSCAASLPWEQPVASSPNPLQPDQSSFILKTSCTTNSQCGAGQACYCGQCLPACGTNQRYSCGCQTCYDRCPTQYFFDESVCACAHV